MDKLYGLDTEYFIGNGMKDIVIFGGGTAGWLTALLVKQNYQNLNVTLIESSEIGILGAGEGTVPYTISIFDEINIAFSDLVKHCKATVKQGINFANWNGDGKSYFHSFGNFDESLDEFREHLVIKQISDGVKINLLSFPKKTSEAKKVGVSFKSNIETVFQNPIHSFERYVNWSTHFDARELANYLKNVAIRRGIKHVDGIFKSVSVDEQNNIKTILLENDKNIPVDFVFDCSGLARLLIGKHYNTTWKSFQDHLPLDTALPFFIQHDNNTCPQTDAIAMKYGWIWRIPVDGRYGCGYVFDSDYIDENQALKEAEEYFKQELKSPKTFKFNAGTYTKTLVKNCMAIGLAQSFVEPLEATSIWIFLVNLKEFIAGDGLYNYQIPAFQKQLNDNCLKRNEEVVEFLYLHYLTKRKDSKFWIEFREKNKMIDSLQHKIDLLNRNLDVDAIAFTRRSWVEVSNGLELLDKSFFKEKSKRIDSETQERIIISLNRNQNNVLKKCLPHKDYLDYLKSF